MKITYSYIFYFVGLLLSCNILLAQTEHKGLPADLNKSKIIFLSYNPVSFDKSSAITKEEKYIALRKENHNSATKQANEYLKMAALNYPFRYALGNADRYLPLVNAGYKYVLECNCFHNDRLNYQPESDVLLEYDFYIRNLTNDDVYFLFKLDEMKIYDYRLIMRKFNNLVEEQYNL